MTSEQAAAAKAAISDMRRTHSNDNLWLAALRRAAKRILLTRGEQVRSGPLAAEYPRCRRHIAIKIHRHLAIEVTNQRRLFVPNVLIFATW